jgi:hypothetical protein
MDILVHLERNFCDCTKVEALLVGNTTQTLEYEQFVMIAFGWLHVYSIDLVIAQDE